MAKAEQLLRRRGVTSIHTMKPEATDAQADEEPALPTRSPGQEAERSAAGCAHAPG